MYLHELIKNVNEPLAILILQFIVILSVTRFFGFICLKISQPSVIGQIAAGIVLGPSLLGYFYPEYLNFLFSPASLKPLSLFSQVGLMFYMFIVGMEIDIFVLKNKARQAIAISTAGIMAPFILGVLLAYFIFNLFAPPSTPFISFALFFGIAMSITAFPVLARILQERDLTKSNIGKLALTCAAVNDVTAWCLLACITAIATAGNINTALITVFLAIMYILVMIKIVRPIILKYSENYLPNRILHQTIVSLIFVVLFASSYTTYAFGIHALFGAFMAGVIMPHNVAFRKNFTEKIEDVSLVVLLPIFFVYSGLRTDIQLLNQSSEWLICLLVILVAIAGKFGGCVVASRAVGETWKDSLFIGTLMNTRGLMELIVLNVGFDLGILTSEIFTILVLMALITTFLTNPALDLINRFFWR